MKTFNQRNLTPCPSMNRRGGRHIYLAVTLLVLFGQAPAQESPDRVAYQKSRLKSPDAAIRLRAVEALMRMGPEAIPALVDALRDENEGIRVSAAAALSAMGPEAIPDLIKVLNDESLSTGVRVETAATLGRMGPEAVPALTGALRDNDVFVRSAAARALGGMGAGAKQALPALTEALKDDQELVRRHVASSLSSIAKALFEAKSTETLQHLKTASAVMQSYPELNNYGADVRRTIDYFESLWWVKPWGFIWRLARDYLYISIPVAVYLMLQLLWLLLFWLKPLLLLRVITSLGRVKERVNAPILNVLIPLRLLLVLPVFYYRTRLLNAWVESILRTSKENFTKQADAQRELYVELPGSIQEKPHARLSAESFQSIFNKSKLTVLIVGEGGVGKTSLACQMALWAMEDEPHNRLCKIHRMLPILIDSNLEARSDGENALVEKARGQLRDVIGMREEISKEFFAQLLGKRRVLVIFDGLSELDETTRESVRPEQPDFPIAALVVTSRNDKDLSEAVKTIVRPQRLKSNDLSIFIQPYLTWNGSGGLFEDDGHSEDWQRLSEIVGGREITVLIAKMFAELVIAKKEKKTDSQLPRNVPELMEAYVNNLNDKVRDFKREFSPVMRAARINAFKCLEKTYRPSPIGETVVMEALSKDKREAKDLLDYLIERLRIVKKTGVVKDQIQFSLDPLAEYLAGLYLVETYGNRERSWKRFIDDAKTQPGVPEEIKGYLLAVRDCCEAKGDKYAVPERIKDELAQLAGLNPKAVSKASTNRRIESLIIGLRSNAAGTRAEAAAELGKIGPAAKSAIQALISTLVQDNDIEVRSKVADALGRIGQEANQAISAMGPEAEQVIEALIYSLIHDKAGNVRASAALALGQMGPEAKQAIPALFKALNDEDVSVRDKAAIALGKMGLETYHELIKALKEEDELVRAGAAIALGNIGPQAKHAIPDLVVALKDKNPQVRSSAAQALGKMRSFAIGIFPTLLDVAKDKNEDGVVRSSATKALWEIAEESDLSVADLIAVLNGKDYTERIRAMIALTAKGPEAMRALPALSELVDDEDEYIRYFAVAVMIKLKSLYPDDMAKT